jgi:hypothetical protein
MNRRLSAREESPVSENTIREFAGPDEVEKEFAETLRQAAFNLWVAGHRAGESKAKGEQP